MPLDPVASCCSCLLLLLQLNFQPADRGLVFLDPLAQLAGALLGRLAQLIRDGHALLYLQLERGNARAQVGVETVQLGQLIVGLLQLLSSLVDLTSKKNVD
jgi:hypothetical protein